MRKLSHSIIFFSILLIFRPCADLCAQTDSDPGPSFNQGQTYFTFQVETLSYKSKAYSLTSQLKQKGFPAFITEQQPPNAKPLYKIRIGKYKTRVEAEKAAQSYKQREQKSYFIVKSKVEKPAEKKTVVKRDSTAGPVMGKGSWFTIQVSTLLDKAATDSYTSKLKQKGFPAYIVENQTSKGKPLYKIRIGKYKTRAEAEKAAQSYKKQEKKPGIVVQSKNENPSAASSVSEKSAPIPELSKDTAQPPTDPITQKESPPPAPEKEVDSSQKQNKKSPEKTAPQPAKDNQTATETAWPETVTNIFAYRGPKDALNLTNQYNKIPEPLRHRIEYISHFPVRFLGPDRKGPGLLFEVEGEQKKIIPAGVRMPLKDPDDYALSYFEQNLKDIPLRLKYNPGATTPDGTFVGRLYLKAGTFINLEMVRNGIGACSLETIAPDQHAEFKKAEEHARKQKAGMWADGRGK
jgi:cell division septation protein DedD